MKNTARALVLALAFLGISCEKTKEEINEATEFNIDYSTQVNIPATGVSVTAPAEFSSPEVSTQSVNRFATENTTKDLVDEIKMTRFNISNPNGNLDFLKSIKIFIQAENLGDVEVASKSNIPAGVSSVAADLSDANIKEYIAKDKIKFKISVTITTGLTSDQTLKIDQSVKVKGKKIK